MSFINTATFGSLNTSNVATSSFTASTITAPVATISSLSASTFTSPVITAPTIGTSSFTASTITANGLTTVQQISERFNILSTQTGGVTHDFTSSAIWYHSSINGNITALFTNVPQTQSRSAVATLIFNQNATPFYANNISVNTSSVTIKWANATVPTPVANRTEVESFTLLNVGGTWTALGQYTSFS